MAASISIDLGPVAGELGLRTGQVEQVVALLDAGNTVPFITRYRKDQTGGLDEEQVRQVQSRVIRLRLLVERKQSILRSIEAQGNLTPELAAAIAAADTSRRLEDLYLPYKPRKQTLATAARERGLELLATEILAAAPACADLDLRAADFVNPDRQVPTAAAALLGAGHILAELFSERADLRQTLRQILERSAKLATSAVDPEATAARPFRDYFTYAEEIGRVPPHRVLAINRGEHAKALRVRLDVDRPAMEAAADQAVAPEGHPHAELLKGCGRDALERLILPSLEREVRRELTEQAETHAVRVFARNLRNLLLQAPVRQRRVLAIDPGFKSGCKIAALDEFGQVLEHGIFHLVGKENCREEARATLRDFIDRHQLTVVAVGNGTACRETEAQVAELIAGELTDRGVVYVVVNEAGASVYSTSALGREEFPGLDATVRGAVSIGRRLQDPLSELVKIEPASIGVGMYQHDVKARHLRSSLDGVVESCVNYVGVDVNTASPALLRHVSGLNQLTARRVFDHRVAHGPFKSREEIKAVSGLGEATFVQAAGFLKIRGGGNPLDATWIHPESYPLATRLLEKLAARPEDLLEKADGSLSQRIAELDVARLAAEESVGEMLLRDILAQLVRPGRDPRDDFSPPMFKREVLKLDQLAPGMELAGTVLNVVDFGAFVDIGLKDTGLVHISQLASKFVKDPHEIISVGDIVRVWVLAVDKERRRVSLTMIPPGTPPRGERRKPEAARRPARSAPPPAGEGPPAAPAAKRFSRRPKPAAAQAPPNRPPRADRPAPKPRPPLRPISKKMQDGKEPLRTFGDLKQLWELNHPRNDNGPPGPPDRGA